MKKVILLKNFKDLKRGDYITMKDKEALVFCKKELGIITEDCEEDCKYKKNCKYENKMMDNKKYKKK